jgi:hypothetical protein
MCLQGMNFLVGLLLLAVEQDCERCFWLLLVLLEKVGTDSSRPDSSRRQYERLQHVVCSCACALPLGASTTALLLPMLPASLPHAPIYTASTGAVPRHLCAQP